MVQLWLKIWISIWQLPPSWILWDINFAGKIWSGPSFSGPVSNLVQIGSKMAVLWPFNWFQNGGRRHLGFLTYVNFDGIWLGDPVFSLCVKFGANMCNNGWLMVKIVIFNMAAAAILDFVGFQFCRKTQLWNLIFCPCVKFGVNPLKNDRVIAV